jgi:hypothetical protein
VTGWRLVPSVGEDRFAVTLEPRKIHREEHGVLTLGYGTYVVGPSIAVEGDASIATFATGATEVRLGATHAWVLQTEVIWWDHTFPTESPPVSPFVLGHRFDRASFAVAPPVTFSPPIERPVMIGDALFDMPVLGTSDIERDLAIRVRAADGGATVLHAGRGFAATGCARSGGLVLAYQLLAGDTRVVSVRPDGVGGWRTVEATLPGIRFDPFNVACNEAATHVALRVETGITLVDADTGTVVVHVNGAQFPAVVRSDGTALVAARTADRMLVFADAAASVPLGVISATSPTPPARAGELAMFELDASLAVIDVRTGAVATTVPAIREHMQPFEMLAWRGREAFVVQLSAYDYSLTYQDQLQQLMVVDATGITPLPLPDARFSPGLQLPGESRLYIRAYDGHEDDATARLISLDLATAAVVDDVALPLCDDTEVLEDRGCR